jgi:ribosome-associated protein
MARKAAPHRGIDVHYGDSDDGDESSRPSKTQLKEQSHALQKLGLEVAELSAERLAATPIPEALRDAILEFRRTKSHEGRRRQLQYVGKLMRNADEDVLREAVASAKLGTAKDTLTLHDSERWRNDLIAGDEALTAWMQQHPDTDTQQLRSLVRQARKDAVGLPPEARQPRSFRDLFQFLKPYLTDTAPDDEAQPGNDEGEP